MPIPQIDQLKNFLPPHLGDPRYPEQISPYRCTIKDVCATYATTPARCKIISGLIDLRKELFGTGIRGYQWLSGSFVENIELIERRPPGDIDVVTFESALSLNAFGDFLAKKPELFDHWKTKEKYMVDHFAISLSSSGGYISEATKYWYALFSHTRGGSWKGMLCADLLDLSGESEIQAKLGVGP